jgi:hypothetical protein
LNADSAPEKARGSFDVVMSAKCFISFGIFGQGSSLFRPIPLFFMAIAAIIEKGLIKLCPPECDTYWLANDIF